MVLRETPRERVDLAAVDLFASVGRPVASGSKAGANIQPEPPSFVFSGTPVILFGEAGETGEKLIELRWDGGQLDLPVAFTESDIAETMWLLQGSRLITDWESRYPGAEAWAPLEKRKQSRVAARLVELSRTYGLASREMSLVALVTRPDDRPGELPETSVVPIGMAQDTEFGAYFRRQSLATQPPLSRMSKPAKKLGGVAFSLDWEDDDEPAYSRSSVQFSRLDETFEVPMDASRWMETAEDFLIDLASRMDSDGGMPGDNVGSRAIATVVAMLVFLSQGHTPTGGAFRSHVGRQVSFLKSLTGLSSQQQEIVAAVIELAHKGTAPAGDWITLANTAGNHWMEVERSVLGG